MYLLDTDHMTLLQAGGPPGEAIERRLAMLQPGEAGTTVVCYEEQMRGWLAYLARLRSVDRQVAGYDRLLRFLRLYCDMEVLAFSRRAVAEFQRLWVSRIRVGSMDLKIAAIALAHDAILLTRNLSDFGKVPGLRIEDWTR